MFFYINTNRIVVTCFCISTCKTSKSHGLYVVLIKSRLIRFLGFLLHFLCIKMNKYFNVNVKFVFYSSEFTNLIFLDNIKLDIPLFHTLNLIFFLYKDIFTNFYPNCSNITTQYSITPALFSVHCLILSDKLSNQKSRMFIYLILIT